MKKLLIIFALILAGCAANVPPQAEDVSAPVQDTIITPVQDIVSTPEIQPVSCDMALQAHQIKKVKSSLSDFGPAQTDDAYTFRIFPLDESGSRVIPAEASVTVYLYSSMVDKPLSKEYLLFTRTYYIKKEGLLSDCGTKPLAIPFSAIRNSDKFRYLNVPNYGIIDVQYIRTGSQELFEEIYNGAEHDFYLIN